MKLLLIEDNSKLTKSLRDFMGKDATIKSALTGYDGLEIAKTKTFDAIILDLKLPDMPGNEVCETLRKAGITTPILVLSATLDPVTKVALLRSGADDYLTKPFHGAELRARLFALMRRGHFDPEAPYILKTVKLTLDPSRRTVEHQGQRVILRRKEFDILEYLLRNKGKTVTRSMIMDNVWGADSDSWDSTVDVHIKHLRDKIDKPFGTKHVKTVYGVGYTIDEPAQRFRSR